MIKLATCCLPGVDSQLPKFSYKTMTMKNWTQHHDVARLVDIWKTNISLTEKLLRRLLKLPEQFHYLRVTSDIFPLVTLPDVWPIYQTHLPELQSSIAAIGAMVKTASPSFRIVTHPGQYCVPNSAHSHVVKNSLIDLQYHYDFMSAFNIPYNINIHCSGKDKTAKERMINILENDMPIHIKSVLSLENDEKSSSITDILDICSKSGVLPCFDIHHQAVHDSFRGSEEYRYTLLSDSDCEFIETAWKKINMKPTMHISNRLNVGSLKNSACAHSDFLYETENTKMQYYIDKGWDIEIEAKAKLEAVQKFYTDYFK